MRVPSPMTAPSSTIAVGWTVYVIGLRWLPARSLVLQRQRHRPAVARREVGRDQDLERAQPLAAVGLGLRFAAQHLDHVVVEQRMAEAVDAGRLVAGFLDAGIVVAGVGELPVLDVVDGDPADPDGAVL